MENRVDFKTCLQKVGITEKVFDIAFFLTKSLGVALRWFCACKSIA
jgi:hypothetical protein